MIKPSIDYLQAVWRQHLDRLAVDVRNDGVRLALLEADRMRRSSRGACLAQSFREIVSVDRHIIVKLDGRVFKSRCSVEGCGVDRRQEVV